MKLYLKKISCTISNEQMSTNCQETPQIIFCKSKEHTIVFMILCIFYLASLKKRILLKNVMVALIKCYFCLTSVVIFQELKQSKDYRLPRFLFMHRERREVNCCGEYFCP